MRGRLVALLAACALGAAARVEAQRSWSPEMARKVDGIFERFDKSTSPGCSVALVRDGRVVYTRGYGMANLDHEIALTPSSVFHVASVSKQFTAAAILLLAGDGRLALDDEVRKYVPELPEFGSRITIRHLIYHTSGLRDQWELLGLAGWRYSLDLITDDDVLEVMSRQKALNFRPGGQHLYCNTGYTLLATIVKRVSGQSFRDFTTKRMFEPLGMTRTHFRDDHAEIVKAQAYGYVPAGETFKVSVTNFDTTGATSLLTTVEDLALWERNYHDGRVGGSGLIDQLQTRGVLSSGEPIDYAFGLTHGTYRGLATVGHGGSDAGYRADFLRFPGERVAVICLCNLSTAGPGELTRKVADVYLADRLGPPVQVPGVDQPAVKVSEQELQRHAGLYWNRAGDSFRKLAVRDAALQVVTGSQAAALKPLGQGRFWWTGRNLEITFETDAAGQARLLERTDAGRAKPDVYDLVEAFAPTAVQLAEYAGAYRSDEIEPVFRIVVEDGKLVLRRLKAAAATLEPMTRDAFRHPSATLRFTRDGQGRVSGLVWNGGRVRGFTFEKARPSSIAKVSAGVSP